MLNFQQYKYFHLGTTSAGTLIVSGSGVLHTINIGTPIAGQIVTIYNATTATNPITSIVCSATTAPIPSMLFNAQYTKGLFIVSTTGAADITVAYL